MSQMKFHEYVEVIKKNDVLMVKKLWNDNFIKMKTAIIWGNTILHEAVINNSNVEIIKFILSKNVRVNERNLDGYSALHNAACCSNDKVVSLLIEHGADINLCNKNDNSPLHNAACCSNDKVVSILIDHGADINLCNKDGDSPLYNAAGNSNDKVVSILIEHGADINLCNKDGDSPLHNAARYDNDKVVSVLIEHGADVNLCNNEGSSPLHNAAWNNNDKVVSVLIEHGADVNLRDKDGDSPLHNAARNNNDKVVSVLMEHGAVANLRNIDGKTPLQLAVEEGHLECASVLKKFARTPLRKITSAKIDVGHEETGTFEEEVENLNEMNITEETVYDIFLSYCHDDKAIVRKIYDHLRRSNYKIWFDDTETTGGNKLSKTLSKGIDNSKVVIVAISDGYEKSLNCEKEFSYAERVKKPIIPVCVQQKYKPTGWLVFDLGKTIRIAYPEDGEENFNNYLSKIEKSVKTSINKTNQNK